MITSDKLKYRQCIVIVQNPRTWLRESDITRDILEMFTHWLFRTRIPAPGSSPILTLSTPRSTVPPGQPSLRYKPKIVDFGWND